MTNPGLNLVVQVVSQAVVVVAEDLPLRNLMEVGYQQHEGG
jgi:hypothetical protein